MRIPGARGNRSFGADGSTRHASLAAPLIPRVARRFLEQQTEEPPVGQPQQEHRREPEQPRLPYLIPVTLGHCARTAVSSGSPGFGCDNQTCGSRGSHCLRFFQRQHGFTMIGGMTALIRNIVTMALAATLMIASSTAAQGEGARLFTAHALALRAAGVAGEKQAEEVLAAMPGAGMIRSVSPIVLWSPFFANAMVKLGRLHSPVPVALFYNPLLDVAVVTFWVKREGGYQVSTVRALPGERLSDPKAEAPSLPSWTSSSGGVVVALGSATTNRLDAFRKAHPAAARGQGRDPTTFAAAATDMRAVFPRLVWNAVQRSRWTGEARVWLEPVATAVEKALGARDAAAIRAAAPDTDAETAAALADLPSGFAAGLALDMVVEAGGHQRLLIASLPEDGDTYVLVLCRLQGDACRLRRFVLASLIE